MIAATEFQPGSLVHARGREWVVLPDSAGDCLSLRPLGGGEQRTRIYLPLERKPVRSATFPPPKPQASGNQAAGLLLRDALMMKLRAGAGPFRSFGSIAIEPRAYQLVPLLIALRQQTVRLLIADDVGIGKTIEAGLIARELLDRGEITQLAVLCPPHLCEQWQGELRDHFNIGAEIVRTSTAGSLERGLPAGKSLFEIYPYTIVSLDYIKSNRRRDEFQRACPEFVIVDEAHTCTQGQARGRHQRYLLLRGLADGANRHMVFLTATPHSGNDEAFYNLLELLDTDFYALHDATGELRTVLRDRLGLHFVQRRRPDIEEWQENHLFPDRLTREATYRLTGPWGQIFRDVLGYAREMVEAAEGLGFKQQRMSWWAALALLRCISSSPAAAVQALRTRIVSEEHGLEDNDEDDFEEQTASAVLDGEDDDILTLDDTVPGVLTEDNAVILSNVLEQAKDLHGPAADPKLKALIDELGELTRSGFHPVVFCRYIATARYVAEFVRATFSDHEVIAVTGELTPAEREEKVAELRAFENRILIATDCLSEGINLQELFTAVIHYDLRWNPTRHEQREGRVDRFGQRAKEVRAIMLYGEDNPVDGAVLRVILRKAERIRKELGVLVPMPDDSSKVTQAVLQAVLMGKGNLTSEQQQLTLSLDELDSHIGREWESLRDKAERNRTIFAQRRIKPEEVLPEWEKSMQVLGGKEDVERFISRAAERLGAPLERRPNDHRLPVRHLPHGLRERLDLIGIAEQLDIDFQYPPADGVTFIHRTHPLVSELADFVVEQALEDGDQQGVNPNAVVRSGAIFTDTVTTNTTLYLLRLRCQLTLTRGDTSQVMLVEEALPVAVSGGGDPRTVEGGEALNLMQSAPVRNMDPGVRVRHVRNAVDRLDELRPLFDTLAEQRSEIVLADHRRVRDAAEARGSYKVTPMLPVDIIGVFVLVPVQTF